MGLLYREPKGNTSGMDADPLVYKIDEKGALAWSVLFSYVILSGDISSQEALRDILFR